ncbi:hypothetical protein ACI2VP_05000 [Ralstonia nicotianae]|uniref:hypothetical protein n=1 Tax=Ralstonia solanacearum species complex TaxID=3116862 RepID=UPI000361679D|nr:hypothetical protein [Ralstonia pseudosolanacearum]
MQTSDKNDIEGLRDAIRVLTPNFQTWIGAALDELVSLRAQADARPVGQAGTMPGTDGFTMACFKATDVPVGTNLYTHPEASAHPICVKCGDGIMAHDPGTCGNCYFMGAEASAPGLSDEQADEILGKLESLLLIKGQSWRAAKDDLLATIRASAATVAEPSETATSPLTVPEMPPLPPHDAPCPVEFVTWALRVRDLLQSVLRITAQKAEPSVDAVGGLKAQTTITLRQAESLLQFFGGHDAEVAIAKYDGGLIAWCTECPEEGSCWLGKTEIDDELADKGRPQSAQQQAEPGADERAALANWLACWDAAEAEGLQDALHDAKNVRSAAAERLADLIERRIAHGVEPARTALAAQSGQRAGVAEDDVLDAVRAALPEFSQQDDYLLAHGASLMSEESHEIIHLDTLKKIVAAVLAAAPTQQQEGGS